MENQEKVTLYEIVQEYIHHVNLPNGGSLNVKARIVKSDDPDNNRPYNYQLNHRTTSGGGAGFYNKDYASDKIEEVKNFMKFHLSLFSMAGAKHEVNENY